MQVIQIDDCFNLESIYQHTKKMYDRAMYMKCGE